MKRRVKKEGGEIQKQIQDSSNHRKNVNGNTEKTDASKQNSGGSERIRRKQRMKKQLQQNWILKIETAVETTEVHRSDVQRTNHGTAGYWNSSDSYNMENTVYFPTLDLYQCNQALFSLGGRTPVQQQTEKLWVWKWCKNRPHRHHESWNGYRSHLRTAHRRFPRLHRAVLIQAADRTVASTKYYVKRK